MTPRNLSLLALQTYIVCSLTAMAPMSLGFVVLFFSWLTTYTRHWKWLSLHQNATTEFKSYRFWALALLITCWGSLIIARFFPYAYAGHDPEVTAHGFLKIWYLMVPAILLGVEQAAKKRNTFQWSKILTPWWTMTIILAVIALIQFQTGWPHAQPIPTNPGKFHGTLFFGHHLSTSSIIIFPAFTALAITMGYWTRERKFPLHGTKIMLPAIAGLAGVLILFLSYARTAWLALMIGMILLAYRYLKNKFSKKQLVAGSVFTTLGLLAFSQTELVKERIQNMMGISERFELWKVNIDYFLHRPITGIGWLKTQEMSVYFYQEKYVNGPEGHFVGHAHSNFFEMLGGTGLLGLAAFLGWSFFTIGMAHRLEKKFIRKGDFFLADLCFGLFIGLILLHFNGLTNVTFWEGKVMHQQMIAVGLLLILDRQLNTKTS